MKMKIKMVYKFTKSLLLTAALLCAGGFSAAHAQSMSDNQVLEYVMGGLGQGKEHSQIAAELARRGVTRAQAERVKNMYEAQQNGGTPAPHTMQGTDMVEARLRATVKDQPEEVFDERPAAEEVAEAEVVFGRNIFNTRSLTFEPNNNMATPPDYRLGPGDEIIVDIWGASQTSIREIISPDGTIGIPELGPVYLSGMTVREAESYLRRQLGAVYSNENNRIKLTLGSNRTIQINIMGEVVTPGTYALSAFATVFHALYRAGGVNDIGSLRNVKVVRNGKPVARVDVYDFIMQGKSEGDIRLQEGDVIIVPACEKVVKISGNVKRPMKFEMTDGESLATLIEYAGGFTADAYRQSMRIVRQNGEDYEIMVVDAADYASCTLENGDIATVGALLDRIANKIEVKGAVYRPDIYALDHSVRTVKALIARAGGLREDAFTGRAVLQRQKENLTSEIVAADIKAILDGSAPDIELRKNDVLYIPSIYDLNDFGSISILGEVASPGTFPYAENMTLEDLIIQAGGLREAASLARVDVSRRIKDPDSEERSDTIGKMFTFSLRDGFVVDGEPGFKLEPYDQVFVRRSPAYQSQQSVSATGEVLYGGTFTLTSRGERLSDLVAKAGGVTNTAYVKGARLIRVANAEERKRMADVIDLLSREFGSQLIDSMGYRVEGTFPVGINLEDALANPGCDNDIVLREGDILLVPKYDNTVKISGAVMMPNTVSYDPKGSVKSYINEAGGYSQHAKRSKKFIIYLNGHIAKARCCSKKQIEPGCEIVVPMRRKRDGWGSAARILGLTTSIATIGTMSAAIAAAAMR